MCIFPGRAGMDGRIYMFGWLSPSREWRQEVPAPPLHPSPYTLHPAPHTLYPTPYTLHPTP